VNSRTAQTTVLLAMTLLLQTGCQTESERLAALSQEHTRRQAEQSLKMAELQEQVTAGSRALVEADAKARSEIIGLQRDIQSERAAIGQQRDRLEAERKQLADERHTVPIIAEAITKIGLLLACLLPLLVCIRLLISQGHPIDDQAIWQILLDEAASDSHLLAQLQTEGTEQTADDPQRVIEQRQTTDPISPFKEPECPTS
jgi:hypothetical protein